jgi:hypothetical protein
MPYQPKTLKEAVDAVMLNVKQHRTATNLDIDTVKLFVNQAIREAVTKTIPFKEWSYRRTVTVIHEENLFAEFIKPITLINDLNGRELRYIDPREWYTLTDANNGQRWNKATLRNGVYTLWGTHEENTDPDKLNVRILIAPYDSEATYTLEAVSGLPVIMDDSDLLRVPYEFENYVILLATFRALAKVGAVNRLQEMQVKSLQEQAQIKELFVTKRATERIDLQSFIAPQELGAPQQQQQQ